MISLRDSRRGNSRLRDFEASRLRGLEAVRLGFSLDFLENIVKLAHDRLKCLLNRIGYVKMLSRCRRICPENHKAPQSHILGAEGAAIVANTGKACMKLGME